MLLGLHVKNLALIEEEEISFEDGLNILTGETGAGKSILLGSVNLALGAKADKSLIRTGSDFALVELLFRIDNERQREKLKAMDIEPDEDGTVLIKRKIYPGRTQCSVCGETVTTHELRELSELWIDVYGQRENQRLLRREAQLQVLDEYAGEKAAELLPEVRALYRDFRGKEETAAQEDLDPAARARETDLLTYEVNEIESAQLRRKEDEELESRYRTLSSFRRIDEALQNAEGLLQEGEESAAEQVGRAVRALSRIQGIDPELDEVIAQTCEVDALLSDAARAISDYHAGLSFDPQEFAALEERLDLINHLKDKYGGSLESIEAALEQKRKRLEELSDYEALRKRQLLEAQQAKDALLAACRRLTELRTKAAKEFQKKMKRELLELNFNQVDFRAEITSREEQLSGNGCDSVVFYISMNPGEPARPLDAIASGGELSRIMLALKTVFAGKDDIHTLIFDEIDSGISGQTAWKVAQKLGRLSADHQILCITHLPQIASMEEKHFLIEKTAENGRTTTHIRALDEEESCRELARMMGGERLTETTLQSAREMKEMAREARQRR